MFYSPVFMIQIFAFAIQIPQLLSLKKLKLLSFTMSITWSILLGFILQNE